MKSSKYITLTLLVIILLNGCSFSSDNKKDKDEKNDDTKLEENVGDDLNKGTIASAVNEDNIKKAEAQNNETPEEETDESDNETTPKNLTPVISTNITLDYIQGKFTPSSHKDFTKVSSTYAKSSGYYLRKDTYEAFKNMYNAAKKDGINLKIISATRNFYSQKNIWEAKWTGSRILSSGENAATAYPDPVDRAKKILEYSSMPGTSRHHWGTDIDLNSLTNSYFSSGDGLKIYNWLKANASTYGFCQPYTAKGSSRPTGYNEEKWHWSYTPVSKTITSKAKSQLKDSSISGFQGSDTADDIGVVENYVMGVNSACL